MAIRVEARAINEHEKLMADAHAEATAILGDAEAEAMELLGKAYRRDPEFYKFIRALEDGQLVITGGIQHVSEGMIVQTWDRLSR